MYWSTGNVKTRPHRHGHLFACSGPRRAFRSRQGFPLLTTKKLHLKSIIYELLWFLRGDTNIKYLHEHGVTIWDEWADKDGSLGRIYGAQWCDWRAPDGRSINQIDQVIEQIQQAARQPPADRQRLERRRAGPDGAGALPCAVSILRPGRRAALPALPAQRGPVPGRALQHRLLFPAHDDGRAGLQA